MNVKRTIETNVNIWNYTHKGVKRRLRRMLQAAAAFCGEESCITVEGGNKYGSFSYSKRGETNPTIIEKVYVGYPCRDTFYLNPTVNKTHGTWNFTVDKVLRENLKYWPASQPEMSHGTTILRSTRTYGNFHTMSGEAGSYHFNWGLH